ncbi:MAG: hypothetical protein ACRC41_14225 [Sarcina sp.]
MIRDSIKNKFEILRKVKLEIDEVIKENINNFDMDELEKFEFIHKVDKMDVILNSIEKELNKDESIFKNYVDENENNQKEIYIDEIDNEQETYDLSPEKTTIIERQFIDNVLEDNREEAFEQDSKIENFESTLNDTNKKIEYLEKLLEEKRFIEEKDLELYMKEIHLKEERDAMLRKRQIVAQSFTPKSREQSDSSIEKTIAMSKEEFYDKIDGSKTEILDIPIEIKSESSNINNSDYCFSEDYDVYEEEKNNSILDKFKDLLGK